MGGEPLFLDDVREFCDTFRLHGFTGTIMPAYGLAEHVVGTIYDRVFPQDLHLHPSTQSSIGHGDVERTRRLYGISVVVVDPDRCTPQPEDEEGEIWLSSPSVGMGYWNQPELSKAIFGARLAHDKNDTRAFLRTGDLGRVCNKQLFISGRIKDLIIVGGKNYYPQDIEHRAAEASPLVRPGCVAAFEFMQDGAMAIGVVFEAYPESLLDIEQELRNISTAILSDCGLKPTAIVAVPKGSIPKTTSGKIRRVETRKEFLENRLKVLASQVGKVYTGHQPPKTTMNPIRRWLSGGLGSLKPRGGSESTERSRPSRSSRNSPTKTKLPNEELETKKEGKGGLTSHEGSKEGPEGEAARLASIIVRVAEEVFEESPIATDRCLYDFTDSMGLVRLKAELAEILPDIENVDVGFLTSEELTIDHIVKLLGAANSGPSEGLELTGLGDKEKQGGKMHIYIFIIM